MNQNIACNSEISQNLGRKIKSYPFWLKIGTHGILETLIPTKSRLWFLKFRPQNPFLSEFGPKTSMLFVLSENWSTQYLKDAGSEFRLRILKFRSQNLFWANFGRKSQSCSFFLKIGMHGILTMLILITTLVFWISNSKSIFAQTWTEKVKVVCFAWNLAHPHIHAISRRCWFLFWY